MECDARPLPRALAAWCDWRTAPGSSLAQCDTILLSIEIMLNAVNLTFVAFGRFQGNVDGQIITFFVMTVAAAEAAVGLAIVIALFRHRQSLDPDTFTLLKW